MSVRSPRARRVRRVTVLLLLLAAPVVALHAASYCVAFPAALREGHAGSVRVLDRDGHLLQEVRPDDGSRSAWVSGRDATLVGQALVATEDRRFLRHDGVDYRAVLRAAASNLWRGRTVSGASTLTMQLARTVSPHARTIGGKFLEAALALRIERELSKDQILEEYENRVEFGPNLRGVGAAARAYFGKAPGALSLGEASLLTGMVRGPSVYGLRRHAAAAAERRRTVLARMQGEGLVSEAAAREAADEPIFLQEQAPASGAPHFVRALLAGRLGALPDAHGGTVTTTLDRGWQRAAEVATQRVLATLASAHVTAASVVVLDNASGDILAYVGSPDFFDDRIAGQNDGVLARRQPGSTLKPFVYELAMERLGLTPATALPDVELHLSTPTGDFSPHDYDEHYRGPVRLREALGSSLNVPAVYVADQLGPRVVLERLRSLGFSLERSADDYGVGIALGDGEVSLLELAQAYATLARGGTAKAVRGAVRVEVAGAVATLSEADEARVLDETSAARITDVLKDAKARVGAFGEGSVLELPFEAAAKTGTSKGYRDNWAVGYTRQVTVAAWAGNFDGAPMDHVSGVAGAGPLMHDVLADVMREREKLPLPVEGDGGAERLERVAVCPLSGERVTDACAGHVFEWMTHEEASRLAFCEMHEHVSIDPRTGLRVGGRSGACERVTRTFERFPPRYQAWAIEAGRPLAPEEFSPGCPADEEERAGAVSSLSIRYPLDGARFVVDPDRPRDVQVLTVAVAAPAGAGEVALLVDGAEVDRARGPRALRWKLEPGTHDLRARAGGVESPRVAVIVR